MAGQHVRRPSGLGIVVVGREHNMPDVKVTYGPHVQPPVQGVSVYLTPKEADVLAYVYAAISGPNPSEPSRLFVNQASPEYNPTGLTLETVRDTLRTIGLAIIQAGGTVQRP